MWYLYIVDKNNKLYTGITTDLGNRKGQHGVEEFLYIEEQNDRGTAVIREREVKKWSRAKKLSLIHRKNER